jgi:uracil-DNA glycosylase family 4
LVAAGDVPTTGCLHCPLFAFSVDFDAFKGQYHRDAAKIIGRLREPHSVLCRCVEEPWSPCDILFVGEAPGEQENRKGLPFMGRSGRLLRETLAQVIDTVSIRAGITNVVRCRPPLNRDPSATEIRSCAPQLLRELAARKPKVIVPLGNVSLTYLTGVSGITLVCGQVLRCSVAGFEDLMVVPCLHPSYVCQMDHELERFVAAIETAVAVYKGKRKALPGLGACYVLDSAGDVESLVQLYRAEKKLVAFDTETGSLHPLSNSPHPRLLCVSLSNREGESFVIPCDHADSPWRNGERSVERERIRAALCSLFGDESVPKVGQNEKFDRQFLRACLGAEVRGQVFDTMLTHLVLDERRGSHGLNRLATSLTGMGSYERELEKYIKGHKEADPDRGGSYASIPGSVLFPYAGADADCTLRVLRGLRETPAYRSNPKLRALAESFFPVLSRTLADMEYAGACLDMGAIRAIDIQASAKLRAVEAQIANLPKVLQFNADMAVQGKVGKKRGEPFVYNPASDPQTRKLLFCYYGLDPVDLTESGEKVLLARFNRLRDVREDTHYSAVVTDSMKKARKGEERELANFSTRADVLYEYDRQGNPLAPLLLKQRELTKLLGTYIRPMYGRVDSYKLVHGTFLAHGTTTGRLSSADPNLQNITPDVRYAYVSRFGEAGAILQADYSQIELRVAASLFNDPTMIAAYRNGQDIHLLTARELFVPGPGEPKVFDELPKDRRREWRSRGKTVNFGIIYGIGAPGLQVTLRKNGIFLDLDECQAMLDRYRERRPRLFRAMEALCRQVQRTGELPSFTGRIRRIPEALSTDNDVVGRALRQTVNFPVQSGASDMTLMALCILHQEIQAAGLRSLIVLTVHDSIVIDAPLDELVPVAMLAKHIMEHIMGLSDRVLPGLDWSWLRVPVVADVEAGVTWGDMVEFKPDVVQAGTGSVAAEWEAELSAAGKLSGVAHYVDAGGRFQYRPPCNVTELFDVMEAKYNARVTGGGSK